MGPQVTAAILIFILLQKSSSPLQSVRSSPLLSNQYVSPILPLSIENWKLHRKWWSCRGWIMSLPFILDEYFRRVPLTSLQYYAWPIQNKGLGRDTTLGVFSISISFFFLLIPFLHSVLFIIFNLSLSVTAHNHIAKWFKLSTMTNSFWNQHMYISINPLSKIAIIKRFSMQSAADVHSEA